MVARRFTVTEKIVITIARQYGSGGREIGEKVAAILGISTYDRELITMSVQSENINPEVAARADEVAANSLLYTLAVGSNVFGAAHHFGYTMPINDRLFVLQSDLIRKLADKESCVIIGRCADYVLRDRPHRLSVFVYGNIADRKKRIAERHEVSESQALDLINKTDRRRASYYNFYTGSKWGRYDNYHLAINSSLLGMDGTAAVIADCARKMMANSN